MELVGCNNLSKIKGTKAVVIPRLISSGVAMCPIGKEALRLALKGLLEYHVVY